MGGLGVEFDLERFLEAQRDVYPQALLELQAGRKQGHWIWFIFPQLHGLGRSPMSERYAIGSRAEAVAYLAHPVLGPRLRQCIGALLIHKGADARDILGDIDAKKFRSCLTLFAQVSDDPLFDEALKAFYGGRRAPRTRLSD